MKDYKYTEGKKNPTLSEKSDFEKLIIAQKYIQQISKEKKELLTENGILQSENEELIHHNKILKGENKSLKIRCEKLSAQTKRNKLQEQELKRVYDFLKEGDQPQRSFFLVNKKVENLECQLRGIQRKQSSDKLKLKKLGEKILLASTIEEIRDFVDKLDLDNQNQMGS